MNGIVSFIKENCVNKLINYLKEHKETIIITVPFILMHFFSFLLCLKVPYSFNRHFSTVLFTISWLVLFIGVSTSLKRPFGKFIYIALNFLFTLIYFANGVYFSIMSNVFDFSLVEGASEGGPYILDALKTCDITVYISTIIIIASFIYGLKKFPKNKETNYIKALTCTLIFLVLHLLTPYTLGKENKELTWSSWRNPRNIYEAYNDSNKSMKISGIFEYSLRNYYLTYLKTAEMESEEDNLFLSESHLETEKNVNKYTGSLKDMNLIIVQLEGMDSWLVNEQDTPTIYKMMNEGINFTNHFSFYNGGGSTFNSEFAINTGYVTPFSYNKNAYAFNKNSFPYSLANLFKNEGYKVNAFHMNSGEYYSRKINYKNWGYDSYNGLKDLGTYTDSSYELDRELILNEKFNELMFSEDKFVDYIITYSGHLPFTNTKGVCKMLYEEDKALLKEQELENTEIVENEQIKEEETPEEEFVLMTEEECIRRQNKETDYMMSLLLEKLEEKELIDKTAIVVVTDHYLYTINDMSILERYKETKNNLINKTPFFIWSKKLGKTTVKEVTSQLNILPTILNLYGIEYNPNSYVMEDALNPSYKGMVFFSDYSWYDGKNYVDSEFDYNGNYNHEEIENKNYRVSYLTKKNDLTLKYNYFNR